MGEVQGRGPGSWTAGTKELITVLAKSSKRLPLVDKAGEAKSLGGAPMKAWLAYGPIHVSS